jgi:UbiA prenyltransferase family
VAIRPGPLLANSRHLWRLQFLLSPRTFLILAKRRDYLAEMYPVPWRLALAALTYFGVIGLLARIHGVMTFPTPLDSLVGVGSLFSLMLIIRLMDEIKDKEIDRELFPHRPLPSGRIFETDVNATIVVLALLYLSTNLLAGRVFWIALIVLGYAWLMFKHFFIPQILQKNLLLTVATHNPMVALMLLYVLALFLNVAPVPLERIDWQAILLLILMNWATALAWEIARKIRCQEEETAYLTYSQIFGRVGSVLVALGIQTVAFAIGLYFAWTLSLSSLFVVLWSAAYGVPVTVYARFLLRPTPVTAKLGSYAQAYMVAVLAIQTVENMFLV